jgi:hypothetical protein
MKQYLAFFVLTLLISISTGFARHDSDWRKITPMVSTKEHVEKLLGKPERERADDQNEMLFADYELQTGSLRVVYSTGNCQSGSDRVYVAPSGTVVQIIFDPDEELSFSTLKLDPEKYKVKEYGTGTHVTFREYSNDEEGVIYKVENDHIVLIGIIPSVKHIQSRCDKVLQSK